MLGTSQTRGLRSGSAGMTPMRNVGPTCIRTQRPASLSGSRVVSARASADVSAATPQQQQQQQQQQTTGLKCPFKLDTTVNPIADIKGVNWRALAPDAEQPPEVPGRPVDPANPAGEFMEFNAQGAGPFLLQRYKEFGPVFSWQMGPTKLVTILDYDAIKTLLQADNKAVVAWNPESFYLMLGESVRENLENPPTRMARRKLLQPGFTKEAMAGYVDKLVGICRTQLDEWAASEGPVDIAARGKDLSFEFSTQLLVDARVSPEEKPALRAKFDKLFQGMFAPPDPRPDSTFSQGIAARAELLNIFEASLQKHDAARQAEAQHSPEGVQLHRNVLDYTLEDLRAQNNGKVDWKEAASSAIGLVIAGNDTSGLGVTALLATLPYFPEVLQKLKAEQQQVVAQHGQELTPAALESMPYADAVIREVLRILPPSAAMFRRSLVDLEVCGKHIPANVPILLFLWMGQVLTDPRLNLSQLSKEEFETLEANWTTINASMLKHEFNPDRWLPGQGGDLQKPSGLLTFSAGPHVCLGMSLFFAEAKVLLALLARDYDMSLQDASADVGFRVTFHSQLQQGTVKFTKRQQLVAA